MIYFKFRYKHTKLCCLFISFIVFFVQREKRQRQLEYAKSLKQHVTVTTSGRSRSSPARGAEQDDDTLDKRKVVILIASLEQD